MWICGATGEVHSARFQFHDEEKIESNESIVGPDLRGGEVDRGHNIPVRFQECLPRSCALARRCRFDAVGFEDVAHGGVADVGLVNRIGGSGFSNNATIPRKTCKIGRKHTTMKVNVSFEGSHSATKTTVSTWLRAPFRLAVASALRPQIRPMRRRGEKGRPILLSPSEGQQLTHSFRGRARCCNQRSIAQLEYGRNPRSGFPSRTSRSSRRSLGGFLVDRACSPFDSSSPICWLPTVGANGESYRA